MHATSKRTRAKCGMSGSGEFQVKVVHGLLVHTADVGNFLWDASRHGYHKVVEVLLAAGITPNMACVISANTAYSALQISVIQGHADIIDMLISAGADMEFWSPRTTRLSALEYAIRDGRDMIADNTRVARMRVALCGRRRLYLDGYKGMKRINTTRMIVQRYSEKQDPEYGKN